MEFRYFTGKDSFQSKYVAVQVNYLVRELTDDDAGFYYTKTQTFAYENAFIKSPVLSTAVKLGMELNAGKRIFFDAFAGAGLRFIFNEYMAKNVLVTSTEPPHQNLFTSDYAWKYNYTMMRIHATAGLRFGLRL